MNRMMSCPDNRKCPNNFVGSRLQVEPIGIVSKLHQSQLHKFHLLSSFHHSSIFAFFDWTSIVAQISYGLFRWRFSCSCRISRKIKENRSCQEVSLSLNRQSLLFYNFPPVQSTGIQITSVKVLNLNCSYWTVPNWNDFTHFDEEMKSINLEVGCERRESIWSDSKVPFKNPVWEWYRLDVKPKVSKLTADAPNQV